MIVQTEISKSNLISQITYKYFPFLYHIYKDENITLLTKENELIIHLFETFSI